MLADDAFVTPVSDRASHVRVGRSDPDSLDTVIALPFDASQLPRLQIAAALPPQARRARRQCGPQPCAEWLEVVTAAVEHHQLRRDAARNVLRLVAAISARTTWADMTARPTWAWLCETAGMARRTLARWLRWLRDRGLLGIVESGTTPELRPMALSHLEGNRASVYVLAVPGEYEHLTPADEDEPRVVDAVDPWAVEESGTPTETPSLGEGSPAGAREARPLRGPAAWPKTQSPTRRGDMLAAAETCRAASTELRRLSPRHVRSLLRPWFRAGWSPADVLHALNHQPDGSAWTYVGAPHSPAGWASWRLGAWLVDGRPGPSREQRTVAARTALAAQQQARQQETARQRAAAVHSDGSAPGWRAARASLDAQLEALRMRKTAAPPGGA